SSAATPRVVVVVMPISITGPQMIYRTRRQTSNRPRYHINLDQCRRLWRRRRETATIKPSARLARCRPLRPSAEGKNELGTSQSGKGSVSRDPSIQKLGPRTREAVAVSPANGRKSEELHGTFMVIVVVITAGILLMASLLRLADKLEPQTGDIIAF